MYSQLLSFINKHCNWYAYQFGFRIQHSLNLALIILVDRISKALENRDFVLGLFFDFFQGVWYSENILYSTKNWNSTVYGR